MWSLRLTSIINGLLDLQDERATSTPECYRKPVYLKLFSKISHFPPQVSEKYLQKDSGRYCNLKYNVQSSKSRQVLRTH